MVQKVTIYPSCSSARTMLPGCCPCAANSIISLQGWGAVSDLSLIFDLSQKFKHVLCGVKSKLKLSQKQHLTPVLKDLHWLPVEQRMEYKVLLLTYKALHGKAPAYISQLLSLYTPTRPLRSENKNLLRVPRCRLEGFDRRCFAYAAPSLWNPLPTPVKRASPIDTFKSSLKTYLFNVTYPSIHWILYCMSILFVTHV